MVLRVFSSSDAYADNVEVLSMSAFYRSMVCVDDVDRK